MKLSILTWVAAVTALLAVSCSQEDEERCGTGYLYMTAETDFSVVPVLKSVETEQPVMVAVTDASGDLVSRFEWSESLAPIELLTGSYSAVATAGTACPAAFDAPLYSATEDFSIRYGEVCNLNLVLALDNVKVTASFSDNVKENFSSYVLTVSNGLEDGTLVYDMDAEGGVLLIRKVISLPRALFHGH